MAKSGRKRTINGYQVLGKAAKFTGRWGLKSLAKGGEMMGRGTTSVIQGLADNEQFQVIATTGGLIAATVAFPPVGIGIAGVTGAKYLADKILGKSRYKGDNVLEQLGSELRETILLGNKVTKAVCEKVISPTMSFTNKKVKNLGKNAQDKIDDVFDR